MPSLSRESHLLINESPLFVLPSLAVAVGLNEAIFIQQVHYWMQGNAGKEHDGRRWVYNTRQEWQAQFPFWSTDAIKRIVQSLRKQNVLLTNANLNRSHMDRTLWYTINYDKLNELAKSPNEEAKSPNGRADSPDEEADSPDALGAAAHSNQKINQQTTQETTHEELWAQLRLLGIPDRQTYIRLVGRGLFDDPVVTVDYARRKLGERRPA